MDTAQATWATAIRRSRETIGWTQRRIADELGITTQTVYSWERGLTTPHRRHQRKLIGLLDITDDEIAAIVRAEDGDTA